MNDSEVTQVKECDFCGDEDCNPVSYFDHATKGLDYLCNKCRFALIGAGEL